MFHAGTGGVIADGDVRLDLGEALGQSSDDVLHGGGTAGGHIAGQGSAGSSRLRSAGNGCGRGSGRRSCTAAGGQGSSSGSSAADGQERTTSDLFHNKYLLRMGRPYVLAGMCFPFSCSLLSLSERLYCSAPPILLRPYRRKMQVKLCAVVLPHCHPLVKSVWKT